jgi:hypothetical protein
MPPLNPKELRWLANELNKWRVPADLAVLRRQREFFPVLVEVIEQRKLSARQRANALLLLHTMCGQGAFEQSDVLVRLAKSLIVSDELELRDAAAKVLALRVLRLRAFPQLASLISPSEVRELLSQAEALGLSEQVLSTARSWLARAP